MHFGPCFVLQQLFLKLNSLSYVAVDVLTGRERMTQMLLMKLVETFVIFIFDDQDFWEEMENGPKPIGQIGLQQVCVSHSSYTFASWLLYICTQHFCSNSN